MCFILNRTLHCVTQGGVLKLAGIFFCYLFLQLGKGLRFVCFALNILNILCMGDD